MRLRIAISVVALTLAACGGSSADANPTGEGFDGLVTVQASGSGQRRVLSYELEVGDGGEVEMTFSTSINQQVAGTTVIDETIDYSVIMEWEATSQSAEGDYNVVARIAEVNADPLYQAALAAIVGLETRQTISSRGEILDVSVSYPSQVDQTVRTLIDQMSEQMGDLAVPFPLQPVGVGAVWSRSATTVINGLETTSVTKYEVTKIEGSLVYVSTTVESTDAGDELESPDLPAGTRIFITDFNTTGSGTTVVDLSRPVAFGTSTSTVYMEMRVEAEGQKAEMVQNMKIEMTIGET